MSGKGFYIAEEAHVVQLLTPVDQNGGVKTSLVCRMKNYSHATIIAVIGTAPRAAGIIRILSCDDMTPTTATPIAFTSYKCETNYAAANGDLLAAKANTPVTGLVPAAGTPNGVTYVMEFDAAQLVAGDIGFRISMADPGAASVMSIIAILSGARYAYPSSVSVTA